MALTGVHDYGVMKSCMGKYGHGEIYVSTWPRYFPPRAALNMDMFPSRGQLGDNIEFIIPP